MLQHRKLPIPVGVQPLTHLLRRKMLSIMTLMRAKAASFGTSMLRRGVPLRVIRYRIILRRLTPSWGHSPNKRKHAKDNVRTSNVTVSLRVGVSFRLHHVREPPLPAHREWRGTQGVREGVGGCGHRTSHPPRGRGGREGRGACGQGTRVMSRPAP